MTSRRVLSEGCRWSVLATSPGAAVTPPSTLERWLDFEGPATAAAALRALGRWTEDGAGAPVDFDTQDWWFRCAFDVDDAERACAVLGFDGLATVCEVWLNGEPLLRSESMYLQHRCHVGGRLLAAGNDLVLVARALAPRLSQRRLRPAWRVPMLPQQQLRWFRTSLLGRAPGWMPPAVVVGPWRDIWLDTQPRLLREDPILRATLCGVAGRLEVSAVMESGVQGARLRLRRADATWTADLSAEGCASNGDCRWAGVLDVPEVVPWWPHTHGEPALYQADLLLATARGEVEVGLRAVGFRAIDVDRAAGAFSLRVNGVPVFCRGACWMPLDVVSLRATPQALRAAVDQVCKAGMNMLRVSGTTVYEEDEFYDACDEAGVLVWQDLMFANMDYPFADEGFARLVDMEVIQQARRWQARPSMAVVCGNSEGAQQAAMWGAPREQWTAPGFTERLASLVKTHLPDAVYWPSSAWGGAYPHQVNSGTTSYYGVGAYLRPLDDARLSGVRFATEALAFSNVPSSATIERMPGGAGLRVTHPGWKARASRDLTAGWDFEDVRDHYLETLFGVDPDRLRYEDHARYLALSRLVTGEVMAATFSAWRAAGSVTGGALVWFLRDLWAGAGWGLLDDAGAPKACWRILSRVLQPQALLFTDEGNSGLRMHLINERDADLAATIELDVWSGETRREHVRREVTLPARSVEPVEVAEWFDRFIDLTHAFRFGPKTHDLTVARLIDARGAVLSTAWHRPMGWSLSERTSPGLEATFRPADDGNQLVLVTARLTALGVHFDVPGYEPDDEFFHLAPGESREVLFRPSGRARRWYGTAEAVNGGGPVTIRAAV